MSRFDFAVGRMLHWDARLCVAMNRALLYTAVTPFFRAVSWLGNGVFWYALLLGILVREGAGAVPAAVHMIAVGIACTTVYKILKRGTLRPRPYEVVQAVAPGAAVLDSFSFPSGHTLHAVAFTILAGYYYPVLIAPLVVLRLLPAGSRVVLGLHYPRDVLAGAAVGATLAGHSFGI